MRIAGGYGDDTQLYQDSDDDDGDGLHELSRLITLGWLVGWLQCFPGHFPERITRGELFEEICEISQKFL